jgi:hypothetical protein
LAVTLSSPISLYCQSGTGGGGGTGGGAVSSVFGRAGAVAAQTGDYTVGQVTGAAPLASPTFSGVLTTPGLTLSGHDYWI